MAENASADVDLAIAVVDLRPVRLIPQELSYHLQYSWPRPLSLPVDGEAAAKLPPTTSGLDASVVLFRHIHSMLPNSSRLPEKMPEDLRAEVTGREAGCPLSTYAWMNVPDRRVQDDEQGRDLERIVAEIQGEFLTRAVQLFGNCTFADVLEGPHVRKSVWSRRPFLMFHYDYLTKAGDGEWQGVRKFEEQGACIVEWDGTRDLSMVMSDVFKVRIDGEGSRCLIEAAFPTVLRVRYTPSEETVHRFEDVRTFKFSATVAKRNESGEITGLVKMNSKDYNLIAVVRERGRPEQDDYVRLYDAAVRNIRPPWLPDELACSYNDDQWRLGEVGHTYWLYFTKTLIEADRESAEVHLMTQEWEERTVALKALEQGELSTALPMMNPDEDPYQAPQDPAPAAKRPKVAASASREGRGGRGGHAGPSSARAQDGADLPWRGRPRPRGSGGTSGRGSQRGRGNTGPSGRRRWRSRGGMP